MIQVLQKYIIEFHLDEYLDHLHLNVNQLYKIIPKYYKQNNYIKQNQSKNDLIASKRMNMIIYNFCYNQIMKIINLQLKNLKNRSISIIPSTHCSSFISSSNTKRKRDSYDNLNSTLIMQKKQIEEYSTSTKSDQRKSRYFNSISQLQIMNRNMELDLLKNENEKMIKEIKQKQKQNIRLQSNSKIKRIKFDDQFSFYKNKIRILDYQYNKNINKLSQIDTFLQSFENRSYNKITTPKLLKNKKKRK